MAGEFPEILAALRRPLSCFPSGEEEESEGPMIGRGRSLPMFRPHIREMIVCARNARLPAAQIHELTGVSARSQRRIAHQEDFGKMSMSEFRETAVPRREAPRPGRPSELPDACRQQITAFLAADPRM